MSHVRVSNGLHCYMHPSGDLCWAADGHIVTRIGCHPSDAGHGSCMHEHGGVACCVKGIGRSCHSNETWHQGAIIRRAFGGQKQEAGTQLGSPVASLGALLLQQLHCCCRLSKQHLDHVQLG